MIAASEPDIVSARAWVPLDDAFTLLIVMRAPARSRGDDDERRHARDPFGDRGGYATASGDPRRRYYTRANLHNDYFVDRQLAKTDLMVGIPFLGNLQDRAMTE